MALFSRSIGRLLVSSRALGKFGLGLMLGFLPCGLIYGALLKAVETARPLAGALTMAAFGMGTAVALLAMGMASSFAGLRMGAWGNRLAGASILAGRRDSGVAGIDRGAGVPWLTQTAEQRGHRQSGRCLTWHPLRKRVHLFCFLAFLALPFLNLVRFDIPRQRFYFAGYELWINEFAIVFFAIMFLMFLVVVSSVFYGRVYCGYLCPQMIFSEASLNLESRLRRWVTKKFISASPKSRNRTHRALFYAIVAAASVFLAFIFISYFVAPRDVLRSVMTFDIRTAAGICGASVTLIAFLDFSLLRLRFCTTVCPYGYLQGMLGDKNTLLVHYRDETHTSASNARSACASAPWGSTSASRPSRSSAFTAPTASTPAMKSSASSANPA
jgi:MFS family permease